MAVNKKLIVLLFLIFTFISSTIEHGFGFGSKRNTGNPYQRNIERYMINKLKNLTRMNQATIGAAIISSAPIPIFLLIVALRIKNFTVLDIMSSFAAGALIGDVFIHNLPEINKTYKQNAIYICWGILFLFVLEKIVDFFEQRYVKEENNEKEKISTGHSHNKSNIIISLVGDFIHNVTDGMAIGAGFNKNLKFGVNLCISIFFHEIPHEVGDFSYLLKQNMSMTNSIISQLITALGSFIGVYLSFKFGPKYTDRIIAFASGAFLYLAINTIMGDLKKSKSVIHIGFQLFAFIFGVYILDTLI